MDTTRAQSYPDIPPLNAGDLRRFLAKFEQVEGACWEWTASKTRDGYGYFSIDRKNRRAHRVSYSHFVGPIPDGMTIDHLCVNPSCVNPAHLEAVSLRENVLRSVPHNARKTHCIHGHEFTLENTRISRGWRVCRACATHYDQTVVKPRRWERIRADS